MGRRSVLVGMLALVAAIGGACTYGHQDPDSTVFKPLVFPGEARLGASVFMVVDSNDIAVGDHLERYDLHRDRVRIRVEGNLATVTVAPRSVFTVETGRATPGAAASRWTTVAFFDLPTAAAGAFSAPYPLHAPLHLEVDGNVVPELEGIVWILGEGGGPTSLDATPLLPLLEDELEPRTMLRLRARGDAAGGFDPAWNVGGITAEVHYDPVCLDAPGAHLGSNAAGGGVTVGPPAAVADPSGLESVRVVVTHPEGFQLPVASSTDATRLGTGPILDITFDRLPGGSCTGSLDQYLWVRGLEVRETDGTQRALRPFPSEVGPSGAIGFDASEYFHFHYVDPDRPS